MSLTRNIGIQIDYIEGGVADSVWPEVFHYLHHRGYRAVVFVGRSLRSPIPLDYQFNRIYNQIDSKNLDGLLILAGLDAYTFPEEHDQILKEFGAMPMVSVGSYYPQIPSVVTDNRHVIRSVANHLWDEHQCRRIAFISGPAENYEARERRAGFMDFCLDQGLPMDGSQVVDGGDYLDYSGAAGVAELLDGRSYPFDALICSSDTQAFGAAQELTQRGIRIPQDVALFGFDDMPETRSNPLGLSTVSIPLGEMVHQGLNLLEKSIMGQEIPRDLQVPSSLVLRSSCGCFSENIVCWNDLERCADLNLEEFPRDTLEPYFVSLQDRGSFLDLIEKRVMALLHSENIEEDCASLLLELNHRLDLKTLTQVGIRSWHALLTILVDWIYHQNLPADHFRTINLVIQKARVLLADKQTYLQNSKSKENIRLTEVIRILSQRFIFTSDLGQIEYALKETLIPLGVENIRIYLFEGSELDKEGEFYMPLPKYCRPVITIASEPSALAPRRKIKTKQVFKNNQVFQGGKGYLVLPLFQTEELLGFMLIEPGPWTGDFYLNMVFLLSSALKSVQLYQSQQVYQTKLKETLKELEKSNSKLKEQSRVDSATELYNRRGFYLLAENNLKLIRRLERQGILFFGDLDGLKIINDTWGHKAGDEAIANAAWVLKQTFRSSDVVARFGGDEFVIMAVDSSAQDLKEILHRLKANLNRVNPPSRAYKVEISLGYVIIDQDNAALSLDELLSKADEMLYKEKQRRKSNGKN